MSAQTNGSRTSHSEEIEEDVPYDENPSVESLSTHMRVLMRNQARLMRMMQMGLNHTLKLQQTVDPLTAQRRTAIIFAGAFAGGGVVLLLLRVGAALAAVGPSLSP